MNQLAEKAQGIAEVRELAKVPHGKRSYPLLSFHFGPEDKSLPTLLITGGVHGLERIGTHLALYHLETLLNQYSWDEDLKQSLGRGRIIIVPMVNPVGIHTLRRSNGNGVDLMRNAPIEAQGKVPYLVGGQRISPKISWFRGQEGAPPEIETQAIIDLVKEELFPSTISLSLDLHSGFGMRDRLWYPHATTYDPYRDLVRALNFKNLFRRSYPFHVYKIEPQSASYITHGDLWDYLLFEYFKENPNSNNKLFMPWTLEMGSWLWVKKNPWQIFSLLGGFNPIKPHRFQRIMRRHSYMLYFFYRALLNHRTWNQNRELAFT